MSNVTINQLPSASTIDPVQDLLPIYTASATATQSINRNTLLGLSSAPVGLTDSQTLSGKTLTSPTINGATLSGILSGTYTIGGTPTFPSSVTTLTGTQTLTNKTLTSPTINSPTITNATLSSDAITGYTTSNAGSIYGISVSGGQITNAAIANGTIGSTQIATNGVAGSNLATSAITLGYAQITSNFTTTATSPTYITGLGVSVTVPSGGRRVKVTVFSTSAGNSNTNGSIFYLYSGATVGTLTTQIGQANVIPANSGTPNVFMVCISVVTPSAGTIAFSAAAASLISGTTTVGGSSAAPAFILVEAI